MLILLALPVIVAVAAMHRYLYAYAPSNILCRHVRAHRPRWSTVAMLGALTGILLVAMKAMSDAVLTGAPGWLNVVVLILAWDSINVGWVAVSVSVGRVGVSIRHSLNDVARASA